MYSAIVFLPLLGFLIAGVFGRWLGSRGAQIVTSSLLVVSALLSVVALVSVGLGGETDRVQVMTWIDSGDFEADWRLRIDTLTAVMLVVVTSVSALVHIYSIGYMSHDPHQPRFFAYLSLFTFAMLMLVTADNFIQLFFGWEGVGLASYLLIGFWYKKPSANAAAIKAFVVNRVGDFGLILGIATLFFTIGSVDYDTVFKAIPEIADKTFPFLGYDVPVVTTACLLLFMGAMGKSAQFLLHTWLPDAMEGPTPVSALIHAATMVTAGVFLVARLSPIFEFSQTALTFVTVIGATTAFFAATVGLVQNDIKRVIAYSTCSQLGYMFVALGVGAYEVAMFHLFTHAFFKALLFLGSGSVIHAMSDEQDMRKMGGLFKLIPVTWIMMVIGTLALTGFPFTAGYYSKDAVIEAAYAGHNAAHMYAFTLTVAAALLTSFYSWRLIFMTFHGESRASNETLSHVHESPLVMLVPLVVLAVGALGAGAVFAPLFIGHAYEAFWLEAIYRGAENHILHAMHEVPDWVPFVPTLMMIVGFATAWLFYIARPDMPRQLARTHESLYKFLLNKWYFDEIYDFLFVRPAFWLGRVFWKQGDGRIIDGLGPDGISARVLDVTRGVVRLQSGYLYHYAFAMLLGVAGLVTWFMVGGTH
ncbi:NADH-quinone oxidoreductase subunit L [Parvibaculum sp.]|uniref:NADH-quinone oxidoreductase subunit L n=1 Tax=Parvibaculum sp. TaxID=2024848 RepID=UPI00271A1475|nr:NADH-quinone oxidoreductase subunit L [Parvibaculum sp.]MDO9126721.1 NADH-quinone oxidoreductase subunit L [Parvibaculum sp.]MDP1627922.1 NADH-quinone oxidoreductase subunit L [Parvibaculum sp.]MDP2150920.1 NADH-quinone oxidoreductase subunit L [Parvibaculum sp.]MDP3327435.1 NADH-quinone oxidoreductase subunit L [Parvibaculum sp.]